MYGGAAGGGKSEALLMAALQWADSPSYSALLLRRTYADLALPGALMDRALEWLSPHMAAGRLHWSNQNKTFTFPSGATVTFGYLETENDKYRYQGAEFQFVGFDELTQFTEGQYTYLFSRLRKKHGSAVPIRMRAASNPGGVGHAWVKKRFVMERHPDRVFIPARLDDNPAVNQDEYRQSLMRLDPFTRAQLLTGDWSDFSGGMFNRGWFRLVDVNETPLPRLRRVRYWDLAATEPKPDTDPDWTVGVLMGIDDQKNFYVLDVRRMRGTPGDVRRLIQNTATQDGREVIIYMEQEPGSAGVAVIDDYTRALARFAFYPVRVSGNKIVRAQPFSSQSEAGNVSVLPGPWLGDWFDELDTFPFGAHDDQVDASSGAFEQLVILPDWQMTAARREESLIASAPRGVFQEDSDERRPWN